MSRTYEVLMEWRDFERDVASIFRVLGADVEHDVAVAGNRNLTFLCANARHLAVR